MSLESLAGLTSPNQLTGTLKVLGNLKDLSTDVKVQCELQLTGNVLDILPKMIEEGEKHGLIVGEYNQTYNVMPGKQDSHKLVRVIQLPPRILELVEIWTGELNEAWVKDHGYPPSARPLQLVKQDASQTSSVKVDPSNPLRHYTGPLVLWGFRLDRFNEEKSDALGKLVLSEGKEAADDKVIYLATHMDGPAGSMVLTVVIQIPVRPRKREGSQEEEPATATPTVFFQTSK
jgi:hypothetical protein